MHNQDDTSAITLHGEPFAALPTDLYIPPGALKVWLESFEGPLDLLLYLIRKNNIDILDIPIAEVTRQYVAFVEEFVEHMQGCKLELAADYLVMAAMLAEIKSRLLLPAAPSEAVAEEEDPRAELVRRLQEYAQFKQAAEQIDALPRMDRDYYAAYADAPAIARSVVQPTVSMDQLLQAFSRVMQRAAWYTHHAVKTEPLSVRERTQLILSRVDDRTFTIFSSLFTVLEGRMGVVVTFLAILELVQQSAIELIQSQDYAPIYVRRCKS